MVKENLPFKEQENKSFKENLELLTRANNLKKRALKLLNEEGEKKNENIES